jgi:hypothetical protein
MPGAFTGTASSTTSQMEKMLRASLPLYEKAMLTPPPVGAGLRLGLGGLVVPLGVMQRSEALRCD